MFQLILPFQLELPFEVPEPAHGAKAGARVRRARVRGGQAGARPELREPALAPAAQRD